MTSSRYRIVKVASGVHSVHSLAHHETFHPVVGPTAEAEALYVRQLRLIERLREMKGDFVMWDIGLGAAGNPITVLRAARDVPCSLHLLSFDCTLEPLQFALEHTGALPYVAGYEASLEELLRTGHTHFQIGAVSVSWDVLVGDFPSLLNNSASASWPKPRAIMFDAFSPAKNPEMWCAPVFARLFKLLDPATPCALPTYSRSTMLRVTLLLAGFYVGIGHATGEKEETTIAANSLSLLAEPLTPRWLLRARRSTSAEPLWEPVYRQAPLSPESWEKLQQHPQFSRPA